MRTLLMAALACLLAATGARAADEGPVKVGILVTLSGPGAVLGQQVRDGFNLAVAERGGKFAGRPVQTVVVDDQLKPQLAADEAKKLVESDKVDFVVGPIFSNVLGAIVRPVTQGGAILISPNAGSSVFAGKACNPEFLRHQL